MSTIPTQEFQKAGICGIEIAEAKGDVIKCSSGEAFRNLLSKEPYDRSAIIGANIADVDPLNLIAAIKKDCSSRKVLALNSDWGLSFSDNAAKAGIDKSVDSSYLAHTFGIVLPGEDVCESKLTIQPNAQNGLYSSNFLSTSEHLGACVCVVSGRGGVGKSTVCILLALSAITHDVSCAIIDADLQFGDLGFLCERDKLFQTMGFGVGQHNLDLSALGSDVVPVMYSIEKPEYCEELSYGMKQLLFECRKNYDLVVINTSTTWSDMHADFITWCDGILLVMDQKSTSVRGGRSAKDLCMRLGAPTSKMFYVINGYSRANKISINDCAALLCVEPDAILELLDGGEQIEEAMSLGIPSSLIGSGNPLVESSNKAFEKLSSRLGIEIGKDASCATQQGKRWLFGRKAGAHVFAG